MTNTSSIRQSGASYPTVGGTSSSATALTGATTTTPRPSISMQENTDLSTPGRQSFGVQGRRFTKEEALLYLQQRGLIGSLRNWKIDSNYLSPLRAAKKNLDEAARAAGTQRPPDISHMVPQAMLLKAVNKMLTEFRDLRSPEEIASFAREFAAYCYLYLPGDELNRLIRATDKDVLRAIAEDWCYGGIHHDEGVKFGTHLIYKREAVAAMINAAVERHSASPQNLRQALLHIMLDQAALKLYERLKSNLSNIFVEDKRLDDIAGVMTIVLNSGNQPILDFIALGQEPLGDVMGNWLLGMRDDFSRSRDDWCAHKGGDAEKMQEAFDELHQRVLTPWVASILESEIPIADKRKECENVVKWTEDSFKFEPANGRHRMLNPEMTKKMVPVYQKLDAFNEAPRGEGRALFYEAINDFMQAQTELLAQYGVTNPRFTGWKNSAPFYKHIVFGERLPEGFQQYAATAPQASAAAHDSTSAGNRILFEVYHDSGQIPLSLADEVGASNITAETAIGLVGAARSAMRNAHTHFANERGGFGQAEFDYGGGKYDLRYAHQNGRITSLNIEGPDKNNDKRVVVHYPQTAGVTGKGKEKVATQEETSSMVGSTAASASAATSTLHVYHSTGPIPLTFPTRIETGNIANEMANALVGAAKTAMAAKHTHFGDAEGGDGSAEFNFDNNQYKLEYTHEEGDITKFEISGRDRNKNNAVLVSYPL